MKELTDIQLKRRVLKIIPILNQLYPDMKPLLHYGNCFELLIGVILSAQCTDAQVNKVVPVLFRAFPGPKELSRAPIKEIEKIIHSTGFFRNKAKHCKGAAGKIDTEFNGIVPESMDGLLSIPGIGRKSANVIRGHCFGLPAIIVDTHFSRVVRRIGLTPQTTPDKIEADICSLVPEHHQTGFSMGINYHGRYVCKSRTPLCGVCKINKLCDFTADLQK